MRSARAILPCAALLALLVSGCRELLDPDARDDCRNLNALSPDTATMRVGEVRHFEATGFQEGNQPGMCVGTIRLGFEWSSSKPAIASVDGLTGEVTAHAVGTTIIRAHLDKPERTGERTVTVVAAP